MTGFVDSVTFTAVMVWCGFQTGNTIELALALARLFSLEQTPGPRFRVVDRQSLASILAFLVGAFAGRIGDRIGSRTRLWLFLGTVIQALCLLAAGLLLWKTGQPSFSTEGPTWISVEGYAAIAFASASMGLQGIMGKRVNTQFATTIVLTTVWCELMADPKLFCLRYVKSRDLKVVAVTALFLGGFTGRALVDKVGSSTTFLIGTVFRILIALLWLGVAAKPIPATSASAEKKGDERV
ncbi:hypothetical protein JB92DRAFT_2806579 [Gautieria morchelliformis]|nr:hypothetical protein JB92DRAFT_2806579 [Gautieria morchelliformis]